jgi:GTP-binding protein
MSLLARAQFVMGVAEPGQFPADRGWEVAFAGRSNAGKSSAINALTGRHRLAFVSKTPGRTQQINYFALDGDRYIVDLPGYGFAKVPREVQDQWGRLLNAYLSNRTALRGLVVIMDVRHPLTPLDRQLLEWFAPSGKPVLVLLTKADKLTRQHAATQLQVVRKVLNNSEVMLFSSVAGTGVEEARRFVEGLLAAEGSQSAPQ